MSLPSNLLGTQELLIQSSINSSTQNPSSTRLSPRVLSEAFLQQITPQDPSDLSLPAHDDIPFLQLVILAIDEKLNYFCVEHGSEAENIHNLHAYRLLDAAFEKQRRLHLVVTLEDLRSFSILCHIFELLCQNEEAAVKHLQNGIRLLEENSSVTWQRCARSSRVKLMGIVYDLAEWQERSPLAANISQAKSQILLGMISVYWTPNVCV